MIDCELVVVAQYRSHKPGAIELTIVRVLKGDKAKPGEVVTASLKHWYSVETRPVLFWAPRPVQDDGVPRLCYKQQMINPGPVVPVLVLPDVRKPAIYFFRETDAPVLDRRGQVQPDLLADGWSQAVRKQPMGLTFRLLQGVDGDLQREAMEELYKSRDPKALQTLTDWAVLSPAAGYLFMRHGPDEAYFLVKLGDMGGDVYGPLFKRWTAEGEEPNPYWRDTAARILAGLDPDRAFGDFSRLILANDPKLAKVAMSNMSCIRTPRSIAWLCDRMAEQQTPQLAIAALEELARELGNGWAQGETLVHQCWIKPRLEQALKSAKVPVEIKARIHNRFALLLERPPAIDLDLAANVLLNRQGKNYTGMAEGEGYELLKRIRLAGDPEFIRLLVRILRQVPRARMNDASSYGETLIMYATLFPNALRKQLRTQDPGGSLNTESAMRNSSYAIGVRLWALIEMPRNVEQLRLMVGEYSGMTWVKTQGLSKPLLDELKAAIQMSMESNRGGPSVDDFEILFAADPEAARALLDKTLDWIKSSGPSEDIKHYSRINRLRALAVRNGHKDLVDELIRRARADMTAAEDGDHRFCAAQPLLESRDGRAQQAYLVLLDGQRRIEPNRWDHRLTMVHPYDRMLDALYEELPGEYAKRVLDLAASPHPAERAVAQHCLYRPGLSFVYDHDAFEPQRRKMLETLRPMLTEAMALPEVERWAYVLRKRGFVLDGPPGQAWLPALVRAAGQPDPDASSLALRCIGQITGRPHLGNVGSVPIYDRERILTASLRDSGLLGKD